MQCKFNFTIFALSFLCSFLALPKLAYSLNINYPPHRDAATADSALQKRIFYKRRQPETAGGSCIKSGMTALVPKKQIGLTDEYSITFLVYVPENRDSSKEYLAELSLINDQDNLIYRTRFKLTGNPGIIKLELPFNRIKSSNNVDLIEFNKLYEWEFTVICDDLDYSSNPSAGGFFKKVKFERHLHGSFKNTPPLPMYGITVAFAYGFWYEGLERLVQAKDIDQFNRESRKKWLEVLKEEDLNRLSEAKLIPCCTLEEVIQDEN